MDEAILALIGDLEIPSSVEQISSYIKKGSLLLQRDPEQALQYHLAAWVASYKTGNLDKEIHSINMSLQHFFLLRRLPSVGIKLLNRAEELYQKHPEHPKCYVMLLDLANSYYILGDYKRALTFGKESVIRCEHYYSLFLCKKTYSEICFELEYYQEAWQNLFESESNAIEAYNYIQEVHPENEEFQEWIISMHLHIATLLASLFIRFRDFLIAERYIQYGLSLPNIDEYPLQKAQILILWSEIHIISGDFLKAQPLLEQASQIIFIFNMPSYNSYYYCLQARLLYGLGHYTEALQVAQQNYKISTSFDDPYFKLRALFIYAEYLLLKQPHSIAKAEGIIKEAAEIVKNVPIREFASKLYYLQALLFEKKGDIQAMYQAMQAHIAAEKENTVHILRGQLYRAKALQTTSFLPDIVEFHSRHIDTNQSTFSKNLLSYPKHSAISAFSTSSFLRAVRFSIRDISRKIDTLDKNDVRKELQSLKSMLQANITEQQTYTELENEVHTLHADSLQTLSAHFSTLSQMELRICSLLKMQLSSHQIAQVLSISVETVYKHRKNIRKKLQLARNDDIYEVLNKY